MESINNNLSINSLDVSGDIKVGSADAIYLGDPTVNDTWRIIRSGDNLLFQQRELGVWNTKSTISGLAGS